jgi:polyketide biosynthesis enoyl-CoA hydratase PksH
VLEGDRETFCMGADFNEIDAGAREGRVMSFQPESLFDLFHKLAFGDFMTVSRVRGKANAGGLGFIAASDIVVSDETATFGLSELLSGLLPPIVLPFLIQRLGFQRAHYLTCSTQTIGVRQAAEWGLVDAYHANSETVLTLHLARLKRMSARSVARYKAYLSQLAPVDTRAREVAVRFNKEMFADTDTSAILRYTRDGLFPWEAPESGLIARSFIRDDVE